jgi:hypothetical protein
MTNALGNFNVPLYASTLLMNLDKALGMGRRVHTGFDQERRTFSKGQVINIKRPSDFTAQNAPGSTAQDLSTDSVQISLSTWKEVNVKLTDAELAYTSPVIIQEHIPRIAYGLADAIDQSLWALYKSVPWVHNQAGSTMAVADILSARKILADNKAPMFDTANLHFLVGTQEEADLLALAAFTQHQGAGDVGVASQTVAMLGQRYGFNFGATQNRPTHTPGAMADAAGTLTNNQAVGDTTISVSAVTTAGTVTAGDSLIITGDSQRYAITAAATASAGVISLTIDPPLKAAATSTTVVTIDVEGTKTKQNLAFHRDAFAFASARLPDYRDQPSQLGANIFSVQDPQTGLAVRVRIWYEGKESAMYLSGDVLYGVKCLNNNLAVRSRA